MTETLKKRTCSLFTIFLLLDQLPYSKTHFERKNIEFMSQYLS